MDSNNNLDSSNVVQTSSEVLSSSSTNQNQSTNSNNAAHSDSKSEEIKPLDTTLPMDEIKRMLQIQLEYYFSRDNLSHDTYLLSQMDSDQYVPIVTVANFDQVKKITRNMELIVEVLKGSQCVQVDASGSKVRPITKRCILILREIPDDTPQSEVEKLFDSKNCPKFVSCSFAHNNSWYITFDSDADAQRAFKYLREEVKYFKGKPIMTRIKNQPITATYSNFKSPGNPVASRPAAAPLPQTPINPAALSSYATNLIPNQETYASMQTNPSLLNQRGIPAYATLPQVPNYPNQAFPQFYPLIQQWPPTSYCDISTIFQINGLAACATIKHYNSNNVASTSSSNGAAGGASTGRSGFPMRGSGLHGNRKNSNSNQGGSHNRHNPSSTAGMQASTSSQQPLVSSGSSGGSMAAGGGSTTTGSNAINSNRMYNESNYLADQQPGAAGTLGQVPLYSNSKSSYNPTNRGSNQSGSNGSNNLASGLAGGSSSGQQSGSLSGSRTSSYPPSSYRNSYVNAGDYGASYPKKKSPNELATNSNPSTSGRGDHSHHSSSSKNPSSTAGLLNSNLSSFNQKSSSRDLDQKSVSSSSSLKGSRNNNSRGKKSPRDDPLLPSTYAEHHAGGYHSQNVYNNTGYREGSRGGHEGGRREPRSKHRTEPTSYVNSSAANAVKDDHHKQFDLQATAFPPLPGANKPGDSSNQTTSQTTGSGATPAASSTTKPTAGKGADGSHADGASGCLADVVKGVKVQREPTGGKSIDETDTQCSVNSKKVVLKQQANHSLNSSSASANRPTDEPAASGKPVKGNSATASSPSAGASAASNHHPNASQVDSYANLASNLNSQVPAKSNNNKSVAAGGKSKSDQLCSPDEPLNELRAADNSSVSSRSACSYSSTADSQRSGELPASRSKLSIDSNASSTSSQQTDRLVQATAECTLNGHLDEKCNSKKLMSYSDVAKLLKNNGGAGESETPLSLNDCSQNSSASSSNAHSPNPPQNKSALDSKDLRDGKKLSAKRDFRERDSGSRKDKNRESRSNRLNTNHRERREKKDWVYGEKQAKVN